MKFEDRSIVFRILLFAFGLAILVAALVLLTPFSPGGRPAALFTTIDAILLYTMLAGPGLYGMQGNDFSPGRTVTFGILWKAIVPYTALTLVLMLLVNLIPQPPLRLFVILQLIGLLFLLVAVYARMAALHHIEQVEVRESQQLSGIKHLRASSAQLAVTAAHLDPSLGAAAQELAADCSRIADALRYLTPVNSTDAISLENQIGARLDSLDALVNRSVLESRQVNEARQLAQQTLTLIARRKALIN